MKNYLELTELLKKTEVARNVLNKIENSYFKGNDMTSLNDICNIFYFESKEDFNEIKSLIVDIAQVKLDKLDYKLSKFDIVKS